jgi:hypothetical protein
LAPQEWPCILPAIQSVLNNSPSSHRAGQTPLTAFTGHARDSPLALTVIHPTANKSLPFINVAYCDSCPFLTMTCDKGSFLASLNTDDVYHIDVLVADIFVRSCKYDWCLNRSAISPSPGCGSVFGVVFLSIIE